MAEPTRVENNGTGVEDRLDNEPIGEPNTEGVTIEFRADDDGNSGGSDGRFDARDTASPKRESERETEADIPAEAVTPKQRNRGKRLDDAATAFGGMVVLASTLIASRYGEVWLVSETEANQLGSAIVKLAKRLPVPTERIGIGLDVMALTGALGAVFGTRYVAWRRQKAIGMSDAELAALMQMAANAQNQYMHANPNGASARMPDGLEVAE